MGSIGKSKADLQDINSQAASAAVAAGANVTSSSKDENGNFTKLGVGYKLTPNFTIEVSYFDLGKASATVSGRLAGAPASLHGEVKGRGLAIDAIGTIPVTDDFSVFLKAGAAYVDVKASGQSSWGASTYKATVSEYIPKVGFGAEYAIDKRWAVRAEFERYFNVGDETATGESDVNVWSVGLKYAY